MPRSGDHEGGGVGKGSGEVSGKEEWVLFGSPDGEKERVFQGPRLRGMLCFFRLKVRPQGRKEEGKRSGRCSTVGRRRILPCGDGKVGGGGENSRIGEGGKGVAQWGKVTVEGGERTKHQSIRRTER